MKTTQSLLLAALTVVTLGIGIGTAMADGGGAVSDYWAEQYRAANQAKNVPAAQFGSSDVERPHGLQIDTDVTGGGL
jgi:hypothetical protein